MKLFKPKIGLYKPSGPLELLLCLVWGQQLLSYVKAVFLRIPVLDVFAPYVVLAIMVVAIIAASKQLSNIVSFPDFFFWVVCVLVFYLTFILFPSNAVWLKDYSPSFIFSVVPMLVIGKAMKNEELLDTFFWISLCCIIFQAYVSLVMDAGMDINNDEVDEAQYEAYCLLPHMTFVLWRTLDKFNILGMSLSVIGAFLLFSYGNRGSVVCIMCFILLYLILCKQNKRKGLLLVLAGTVAFLVAKYILEIALALGLLTESVGMSTRVYRTILEGEFTNSSGRGDLQEIIFSHVMDSPLGMGLCGDKVLAGQYSHNLFLEILISFGPIIGVFLCIVIIIVLFKGYRSCNSVTSRGFFLVLFSCSFIKMFISSTFLSEPLFFMLMGYSLYLYHFKHSPKIVSKDVTQ